MSAMQERAEATKFGAGVWLREMISREALKIVLLPTCAAIAYGIVMDQITIRVCPEYFTIAHPHILNTGSLTLLALAWGVVATWWAGAIAGVAFAFAARAGKLPKVTWRRFVRPLAVLALVMALCTIAAGFIGAWMVNSGSIPAVQAWAMSLPLDKQAAFMADAFAHVASYLIGALGCLTIAVSAAWKRYA
ncbi:MAG TPA: hypothetical protein VN745_09280 [Verrucomicrobiae bacterium]|nr:hypothetical protein [Verrucomicrobiae bacterium]